MDTEKIKIKVTADWASHKTPGIAESNWVRLLNIPYLVVTDDNDRWVMTRNQKDSVGELPNYFLYKRDCQVIKNKKTVLLVIE